MTKGERSHLAWAMGQDGMSGFWVQLVLDKGPRGQSLADRLWRTLPRRYRFEGHLL